VLVELLWPLTPVLCDQQIASLVAGHDSAEKHAKYVP